jgi:predicted dehydrogenase
MNSDGAIRFGVVGTTWYAEMHLGEIAADPGADLVAVCGRNQERARDVADRHGAALTFASWQAMIDSGEIDAILIVAPDSLHEPIAVAAAGAGIHVVCEKPLAATAAEARRMWVAAEEAGVSHMSYFALRNSAVHRQAKALVADGFVGTVTSAEMSLTHGFFRGDVYDWRFDAHVGTGVIGDLSCYLFELALWYVGGIDRVTVASSISDRPKPDGSSYPSASDAASGVMVFDSGAHATFAVSTLAQQAERGQLNSIRLFGTGGTIEIEHTLSGSRLRVAAGDDDRYEEVEAHDPPPSGAGIPDMVAAIAERRSPASDFEHGWEVQCAVEAALRSEQQGGWVTVERAPT